MVREFKDKKQNLFLNIWKNAFVALSFCTWQIISPIYGTSLLANISIMG